MIELNRGWIRSSRNWRRDGLIQPRGVAKRLDLDLEICPVSRNSENSSIEIYHVNLAHGGEEPL